MTELKHTKGPWKILTRKNEYSVEIGIDDNDPLCKVFGADFTKLIDSNNANALLISCAPEMLGMLIETYIQNDHWGNGNYHKWSQETNDKVKDIIEKATGLKIEEVLK